MVRLAAIVPAVLACGALAGCVTPRVCTTSTEVIEVEVAVWQPVPDELIRPLDIPSLPEEKSNAALLRDQQNLESVIQKAQEDRAAIRKLNERNNGNEPKGGNL